MQIVDKIFFDPITKGLKFFGKHGSQEFPASNNFSRIRLHTSNGYGSTNTRIKRFSTVFENAGTDIVYADSATLGASFTVSKPGIYSFTYTDNFTGSGVVGLSLNTTQPATSVLDFGNVHERLAAQTTSAGGILGFVSMTMFLNQGDIIRAHTDAIATSNGARCHFTMYRIA